jgi:FkbH-like protein
MNTLSEILSYNKLAKGLSYSNEANISILSNVVVNQIQHPLAMMFYKMDIKPKIEFGEYDNIVQDAARFNNSDVVIIFWELNNLLDGIQYLGTHFSETEVEKIVSKTEAELMFVFKTMEKTSLVLINEFTTDPFNSHLISENATDKICDSLNQFLKINLPTNFKIVKTQRIISKLSINGAFDLRNFYTSKALHSFDFFKAFAEDISPFLMSRFGKAKKVLVLDCDNTLWGGIIGEDGVDGIKCDSNTGIGKVYYEVQKVINSLTNQGVIICINSKNNFSDVEEAFSKKEMPLDYKKVVIKKVNWENKVKNLLEISQELNVGVDSLLFVDDSDFEINLVKQELSEVEVIQVPKDIYQYPLVFRKAINRFYNLNFTSEDSRKTEMYIVEQQRKSQSTQFDNLDSYLESLQLSMVITVNAEQVIDRVSQMTQKTNQFNSTSLRLTPSEVKGKTLTKDNYVFSFSLSDKFGDFGTTGAAFVSISDNIATIDDLLMSCRVLGRKAEETFVNELFRFMKEKGVIKCLIPFVLSNKNKQVEDFFILSNFKLVSSEGEKFMFESDLLINEKLAVIKVRYER